MIAAVYKSFVAKPRYSGTGCHNKYHMRDLIDLVVTESVGLANRRPGDRWQNASGDEIVFQDLKFYPEKGAYADVQAHDAAFDEVTKSIGHTPQTMTWITKPTNKDLAFALAHFKDANDPNRDHYIAKAFKDINPIRSQNKFPNDLPGGFRLQTKAAKKEASGYKPTEVLTQLQNQTPDSIFRQVQQRFGADSAEAQAMALFMAANKFPLAIPLRGMNATAFSNYFCEMLQPMALVMGKPVKGNAAEAERLFLGGQGFRTCSISFGTGQNTGLSDSTLTNPQGQQIILSSKAGSGAFAAASNLKNKMDEVRNTAAGQALLQKYGQEVAMLDTIVGKGYIAGPLTLAQQFGILNADQAATIMSMRKVTDAQQAMNMLDDNLKALYNSFRSRDASKTVPFFHMLTAVARAVEDRVNTATNFSRAASDILNQGALIQMYTVTRTQGDNIVIEEFNTVYPSQAVTDVMLRSDKTYYSTGNKGNFTFEILKNNAKSAASPQAQGPGQAMMEAYGRARRRRF